MRFWNEYYNVSAASTLFDSEVCVKGLKQVLNILYWEEFQSWATSLETQVKVSKTAFRFYKVSETLNMNPAIKFWESNVVFSPTEGASKFLCV